MVLCKIHRGMLAYPVLLHDSGDPRDGDGKKRRRVHGKRQREDARVADAASFFLFSHSRYSIRHGPSQQPRRASSRFRSFGLESHHVGKKRHRDIIGNSDGKGICIPP